MKSLKKLLSCGKNTHTTTPPDDIDPSPASGPKPVTGQLPDNSSTDSDDDPDGLFAARDVSYANAVVIPQASRQDAACFFLNMPLEIRQKVYVEVLAVAGPMQYIYRGRDISPIRLRYGTSYTGSSYRRFMGKGDKSSRFRHEPCCIRSPLLSAMDQALYHRDGVHFDQDPSCMFLPLLLVCRQVYHEVLPVMGSEINFCFDDLLDARRFLLKLHPPIVNEMRTVTLQWGVFWIVPPENETSQDSRQRTRPRTNHQLYIDLWQRVASLPKLRELNLWVYWGESLNDLGGMGLVKYVNGEIVEGPTRLLDALNLTEPVSPPP